MSATKAGDGLRGRGRSALGSARSGADALRTRAVDLRDRARRERGIRVRETFTVRGPAASETEGRVETVFVEAGCSRAAVGPGRYRYARAVRPLPVMLGGGLASVVTLGLALPSLLFRRTEECYVSVEESPMGARVTVVGTVPASAMTRLRSDLGGRAWEREAVISAGGPQPVADGPTRSALRDRPRLVDDGTLPRVDDGTRPRVDDGTRPRVDDGTRPRPPADPPTRRVARQAPAPVDDRTYPVTRGGRPVTDRPAAAPTTHVVLELDNGTRAIVAASTVVGRNPDPSLGSPIPVEDRERTISKSHFRVLVEPDGVWLEDLSSTNGTMLELPDGRSTTVHPGRRYPVTPGCTVRFGDRRARLVGD